MEQRFLNIVLRDGGGGRIDVASEDGIGAQQTRRLRENARARADVDHRQVFANPLLHRL